MFAKRSQASASVRKRSQSVRKAFAKRSQSVRKAFAIVRGGSDMPESPQSSKSSRNAELSSLFTFRLTKVSTVTGIGGAVLAKRRTVVTLGLASVFASQKCQQLSTVTGGVVLAKRRNVVTFGLASGLRV